MKNTSTFATLLSLVCRDGFSREQYAELVDYARKNAQLAGVLSECFGNERTLEFAIIIREEGYTVVSYSVIDQRIVDIADVSAYSEALGVVAKRLVYDNGEETDLFNKGFNSF